MNIPSEQIDATQNVLIDKDRPLTPHQQEACLIKFLGKENCCIEVFDGHKVFVYRNGSKTWVLLHRAVTYLGGNGQHPLFKKRMQLPAWFKELSVLLRRNRLNYDVRFLGIYHYDGLVLFIDFQRDTYLAKSMHNSSAHVYINDMAQGLKFGVFHKEDQYGNHLHVIRNALLKDYLDGKVSFKNAYFDLFEKFNHQFPFGKWLLAVDVIKEMYRENWPKWKEAEWAGFFLEYKIDAFIKEEEVTDKMQYISQKKKGQLDFDLHFQGNEEFYGDLKASDIKKRETPANDQENVMGCINQYGKLWYIIYEHETRRDAACNYQQTVARNQFIRSVDSDYKKGDMSYAPRMKNSVNFIKMSILEINRVNCRELLKAFNQGHQADGTARKPKFIINKSNMDNFIIFRHHYER